MKYASEFFSSNQCLNTLLCAVTGHVKFVNFSENRNKTIKTGFFSFTLGFSFRMGHFRGCEWFSLSKLQNITMVMDN